MDSNLFKGSSHEAQAPGQLRRGSAEGWGSKTTNCMLFRCKIKEKGEATQLLQAVCSFSP